MTSSSGSHAGANPLERILGTQRFRKLRAIYRMATREELRAPLPWGFKLWAWGRGFKAKHAILFDRAGVEAGEYLDDYTRDYSCARLNPIPRMITHKMILRGVLAARKVRQPELIAFSSAHGILVDLDTSARYISAQDLVEMLVRDNDKYIWKPEEGSMGRQVMLLEIDSGRLVARRGTQSSPFDFEQEKGVFLLERSVKQHPFWQSFSPYSLNTLRIQTMWTPGDASPFIAFARQRMGTIATMPTDNWSGGGIMASVDIETGRLGIGRVNPAYHGGDDKRFAVHPETGAQIDGAVLPNWNTIKSCALAAAHCVPHQPYVAWDVAVDAAGIPLIIEGNKNFGTDAMQQHGGVLTNPAVRRFYETCGVI